MKTVLAATVLLCAIAGQTLLADTCSPKWVMDETKLGVEGSIRTLLPSADGQALYAGGTFTAVGGVPALNVARFDGQAWHAMGHGLDGTVWAFAFVDLGGGTALYAGGEFTMSGATSVAHVARWDGNAWQPVGGGTDGGVFALAGLSVGGSAVLVAGGQFGNAGGTPVQNIARFNGSSWSALGSGVSGGIISFVRTLAVFDSGGGPELYAGGLFTNPAKNIARWNGAAWSALGTGAGGTVNTMVVWNDSVNTALYVAGYFTSAGNVAEATRIARWNGTTWSGLDAGLGGEPIWALAAHDDGNGAALYAGGQFTLAGTLETRRIARWNGTTWSPLAGGILDDDSDPCWCDVSCEDCGPKPAVAYALAAFKGSLYVAGEFSQPIDCRPSPAENLMRWTCKPADTVAADWDWDRNISSDDIEMFMECATGPMLGTVSPCCEPADLNHDDLVDMIDFAILQRCLSIAPGTTPSPDCGN